ncbi:MAG TPA: APC family permease [Vicinamibacterales bacterium]|nr:APC family permease [Vicinamibacterales bacterium]
MSTVKPDAVEVREADLRKDLGVTDLTLTQILFIVGLPWVGVAAKEGPSHVVYWLLAIVFFYLPSAAVVIYLNRAMPLEGGLYQWAKLGFNGLVGFLVAWNLWLFAILNSSETGLQVTQYAQYVFGHAADAYSSNPWIVTAANAVILTLLAIVTIRGLSVGKWVHASGGALMVTTFAMIVMLPWLNLAHGTLTAYQPLATAVPAVSILSLNIAAKMGFGALGGFEYVAIHAGECRDDRAIAKSVWVAAPIICVMFVLGTSSVLALVPFDQIDLIAPIPQVLATGFGALGPAVWVAPITIVILLCIRLAQASVMFTGITRLPMVAGWDGLLPSWFMRLHPRFRTPVNSVVFIALTTFAFGVTGLIGVGKQEAFQLLWNASGIFYALTYLVMFAIPIVGSVRAPAWLKVVSASGFVTTLGYVALSILPIIDVGSRLSFAIKITAVILIANMFGYTIFKLRGARA